MELGSVNTHDGREPFTAAARSIWSSVAMTLV